MPGLVVTVQVFNSAGEVVYTGTVPVYKPLTGSQVTGNSAFIPNAGGSVTVDLLGTGGVFTWNGVNNNGQTVSGGSYTVVTSENPPGGGSTVQYSSGVTVLSQPAQNVVAIYNSAGEMVQQYTLPAGAISFLNLSSNSLVPQTGAGKGLTISVGNAPGDSVTWNGLNAQGQQVSSGTYQVVVLSQSPSGPVKMDASVQVIDAPADLLAGAMAGPEPLGAGKELTVVAPNLAPTDSLVVEIYDLAGERVAASAGVGPTQTVNLPRISGGVYLVVLTAHSSATGGMERKVLKLAVLR
jgi:flagellar hook assembly protein FlgD